MDNNFDIPDATDWLETPVSKLGAVESALRCQVCKDFFNTPMITSCSHTFCSLCIRRCLTEDGVCPICRTPDQMTKLRQNATVQEIVDTFQIARCSILQLGRDANERKKSSEYLPKKRKLKDTGFEVDHIECDTHRVTRSRDARERGPMNDDDDDDEHQPDDGLSACPICDQRMREDKVFPHLDVHNDSTRTVPVKQGLRIKIPMERLPQINYSLLKDNALRKKLLELGIPQTGSRTLLARRHTEWVNLVNANCDSKSPKPKQVLLRELDTWDKTQGRHVSSGALANTSSVMKKDFDGSAWASSHDTDFKKLIIDARRKNQSSKVDPGSPSHFKVTTPSPKILAGIQSPNSLPSPSQPSNNAHLLNYPQVGASNSVD